MEDKRSLRQKRAKELWRIRLRQAVDDRGLDYTELSQAAGYNHQFLTKVFNGELNPSVERIQVVCSKAGIRMAYLFEDGSMDDSGSMSDLIEKFKTLSDEEGEAIARILSSARSG